MYAMAFENSERRKSSLQIHLKEQATLCCMALGLKSLFNYEGFKNEKWKNLNLRRTEDLKESGLQVIRSSDETKG